MKLRIRIKTGQDSELILMKMAAFSVVGRAIEAAIRSATAAGGIPALEGGG